MTRLIRIGPVAAACLLLGACGQLLGLNNYEEVEGAAGTGGSSSGGRGGRGGQSGMSGHAGGPLSSGGTAGDHGGTPGAGGTGGRSELAGAGGEASPGGAAGSEQAGAGPRGGKGGTGNSTGGTGGSMAQGGGGEGGCSETIEISTLGMPTTDPQLSSGYYSYEYNIDPQIDTAASDYLWIDFYTGGEYDGEKTGRFYLGTGQDANYASCSRCVWLGVDVGDSGTAKTYFYAKSGTLDIAADSEQMNGLPDAHLSDVLLSEIKLDSDTHVSTEVWGGRCLHLTNASLVITSNAPSTWKCPNYAYGTNDGCDCGCGAPDPDCASDFVGACDYCDDQNSCASSCADIKLSDNSKCSASAQGWTCDPQHYGDGSVCDCGCGIVDYDCPGADASYCGLCDDPNSCTASGTGTCSDISPTDNSHCQ